MRARRFSGCVVQPLSKSGDGPTGIRQESAGYGWIHSRLTLFGVRRAPVALLRYR